LKTNNREKEEPFTALSNTMHTNSTNENDSDENIDNSTLQSTS